MQVSTDEGSRPDYVANEGAACYECKTELYTVLAAAGRAAAREGGGDKKEVLILNGTNADDLTDPTRLGLLAATEHRVISPLATLPKAAVRMCARAAGLPNWDLAGASPCVPPNPRHACAHARVVVSASLCAHPVALRGTLTPSVCTRARAHLCAHSRALSALAAGARRARRTGDPARCRTRRRRGAGDARPAAKREHAPEGAAGGEGHPRG